MRHSVSVSTYVRTKPLHIILTALASHTVYRTVLVQENCTSTVQWSTRTNFVPVLYCHTYSLIVPGRTVLYGTIAPKNIVQYRTVLYRTNTGFSHEYSTGTSTSTSTRFGRSETVPPIQYEYEAGYPVRNLPRTALYSYCTRTVPVD